MADLLALQPNMDIKLHIVAPLAKRDKVFNEIRRPVFSLLDRGPLAESCTYLSYDSLSEVASQKHVAYLSDRVLDEYAEEADRTHSSAACLWAVRPYSILVSAMVS
jgi:kynureninase